LFFDPPARNPILIRAHSQKALLRLLFEISRGNMPITIGLDLGTSHCKAVAIDSHGRTLAEAQHECLISSPQPGWVEQDAGQVWSAVVHALADIAVQLKRRPPAALCLSSAMHSLLPVNEAGEPLAHAMTWADMRAAPQAARLRALPDSAQRYERTGCPLRSIYHPAKLLWWHEQEPEIVRQAARFVTIKDYVLHRLTGHWAIDYGLASASGLLDIHTLQWDADTLAAVGIEDDQLSGLVSPLAAVGDLLPALAPVTGMPYGLPIIAGSADGGLANLGSGAALEGQSVVTIGTSGAVRRIVNQPQLDPQARTWCYVLLEGRWYAGGAINNGGLALRWAVDRFYPELDRSAAYERLFAEAAEIAPGAEGVTVLPYFTGERAPHWNPKARGVISGLGANHTRAHIARAVLEGVAYCLADVWDIVAGRSVLRTPTRLTGRVTHSPVWAQIIASVLGVPLALTEAADASAVGAAMLGQLAMGYAGSIEELTDQVKHGRVIEPDPHCMQVYEAGHEQFRELYAGIFSAGS
jgi:gluconokinase